MCCRDRLQDGLALNQDQEHRATGDGEYTGGEVDQARDQRAADEQEGRDDAGHRDGPERKALPDLRAEIGRLGPLHDGDLDRAHAQSLYCRPIATRYRSSSVIK